MRHPTAALACTMLVAIVSLCFVTSDTIASPPSTEKATPRSITPADWSMYNHDLSGWRFNPAEKTLGPSNVARLVEKWRFPAVTATESIGVVHATPTVVAGEVYFGTATFPAFYKLAPDGKLLWVYRNPVRKDLLPPNEGAPVTDKLRARPRMREFFARRWSSDGSVYFADTGGWMYCIDATTAARALESQQSRTNVSRCALEQPADGLANSGGWKGRFWWRDARAALCRHSHLRRQYGSRLPGGARPWFGQGRLEIRRRTETRKARAIHCHRWSMGQKQV